MEELVTAVIAEVLIRVEEGKLRPLLPLLKMQPEIRGSYGTVCEGHTLDLESKAQAF